MVGPWRLERQTSTESRWLSFRTLGRLRLWLTYRDLEALLVLSRVCTTAWKNVVDTWHEFVIECVIVCVSIDWRRAGMRRDRDKEFGGRAHVNRGAAILLGIQLRLFTATDQPVTGSIEHISEVQIRGAPPTGINGFVASVIDPNIDHDRLSKCDDVLLGRYAKSHAIAGIDKSGPPLCHPIELTAIEFARVRVELGSRVLWRGSAR